MRYRAFTLVEMLTIVAVLVILAAILFPVFTPPHHGNARRSICQSNLKQIALGLKAYVQDSDDRYPPVAFPVGRARLFDASHFYGWVDGVQPYSKSLQIFHCPSVEANTVNLTDPTVAGYTDYWMNTNMAGIEEDKMPLTNATFLLGEGNDGHDGTDARYHRDTLPAKWLTDEKSPAFRHLGGANYAFVDGHVKWLKPANVTNDPVRWNHFTFAAR